MTHEISNTGCAGCLPCIGPRRLCSLVTSCRTCHGHPQPSKDTFYGTLHPPGSSTRNLKMMVSKRNLSFFPGAHFQVNHGNNLQVDYDHNNIFFKWYQLLNGSIHLYLNINCWYWVPFDTPLPSCKWHGSNWPNVLANQAWSSRTSRTVAASQPLGSTKWNMKKLPKTRYTK